MKVLVTWQEHLERCARLGISPRIMSDADLLEKRPPRPLTDSQKEALLKECHETGKRIAEMKLLPETLAAMKARDEMTAVLTDP